jgi:hypothetical protein
MNTETTKTQTGFSKIIATTISYLFHPVFFPIYLSALVCFSMPDSFALSKNFHAGFFLARIAYLTVFFPLLTVLLLKALGFVESIQLKNNRERIVPLMASMIFYFWAYWVMKNDTALNAPKMVKAVFLGNFWGIICLFMANIFVKVSMHATAAGALLGLMILFTFQGVENTMIIAAVSLLLAAIIGWARMTLSAHKISEVWFGYVIGLLCMVAGYGYIGLW